MADNFRIKLINQLKMWLFCFLMGAFAGIIIWVFLKVMSLGVELIWHKLPDMISFPFYTLTVCTVGGLIIGLFRKKFGDYPEELSEVIKKTKTNKTYEYRKMAVILLAALMPLLIGSSVGPESGLVGIIVGLCFWVGDNLKSAYINARQYSNLGIAVTLSVMFHSPLFGIFTVEENDTEYDTQKLRLSDKILLYALSLAGGTASYMLLSKLFGSGMSGFPSFPAVAPRALDYPMIVVYIICGCILAAFYHISHKYTHILAEKIPGILRETLGGICLGIMGTLMPILMFSGEEEIAELISGYEKYLPAFLIAVSLLKILLTNICISSGLKGGHFFPIIFAGVCLGYGISMLVFPNGGHEVFAAAVVTATLLGGVLKKPFAVTMLLFICFPVRLCIWIFIGAAIGKKILSLKPFKHSSMVNNI